MAADDPQRTENMISSRMMLQDETIHISRTGGDHASPRKSGFAIDGEQNPSQYGSRNPRWDLDFGLHSDRSDGEDEEDGEDDVDDDDDFDEGDGLVSLDENNNNIKNGNNSSGSVQSSSDKANGKKARNVQEHHFPFGSGREMMGKDGNLSEQQHHVGNYDNAIAVVQPELYGAQIMNGEGGSCSVQKETRGENVYGFGRGKEFGMLVDPGESLRTHLMDPVTGVLMDDAMILPCGHSFGGSGMQHAFRMRACSKCSRPISEDLVRPNLALRSAVQAFRREEESQSSKVPKRRRERFEQEKCSYDDPCSMDSRGKGVQFPFVVSDRVIIKGNKRTPQCFVGRVAVVTTQCLNGWYVVKTLDNAESVKVQYRSLAKVPDDTSPSSLIPNKPVASSWL